MRLVDDDTALKVAPNGARPWCTTEFVADGGGREFGLTADLRRAHRVRLSRQILSPDNPLLRDSIEARPSLVVMSPSIQRIYGDRVRAYFDVPGSRVPTHFMVLNRSESSKSLSAVVEVCDHAMRAGLLRTSPVVAIGGGVCSDICGLAAALYHRGIPRINVPTTLIGLVDAGIGTKNAVNHLDRKNALGSFHPPEHSLLDPGFLASLPRRHLINGMAEIVKLAIVRDRDLFTLLHHHGRGLVESGFQRPAAAADEVIRRAVGGMLDELSQNLFEIGDLRRAMDFGHTFSPYIEVASDYTILHGEAVAMELALSAQIAHDLGLLRQEDLDNILLTLDHLGLALTWARLSVVELWKSLESIVKHRNDELHLVVPTNVGSCTFVSQDEISPRMLTRCVERLTGLGRTVP